MAQQEGGWPLGLQPLNVRIGLVRNVDFSGSLSFSTLITGSSSSSSTCSSDLDTESTGSFFRERSITLGSLIGITSILDVSNRSLRRSRQQENSRVLKKNHKAKAWFSLCTKAQLSGEMVAAAPSLGHFLEAERRASNAHQARNGVSITYELDGLPQSQSAAEPNSLFSNGLILPPPPGDQSRTLVCVEHVKKSKPGAFSNHVDGIGHEVLGLDNGHCLALMFPCVAGQATE